MRVHKNQRLEITLDLFKGCGYNCSGCMVDKEIGSSLDNLPEIEKLINEMLSVGYIPYDVNLGPTDYITSSNSDIITNNENVISIINKFNTITFNASFLDKDIDKYISMCSAIDRIAPNKSIRFLIPASPRNFKTDAFKKMIGKKIALVKNTLTKAILDEASFVINCTHETVDEEFNSNILASFTNEKFPVKEDHILNIPYGRLESKNILMTQNIRSISYKVNKFYCDVMSVIENDDERYKNPDYHYNGGLALNLLYLNSKLYWVPFLKDELVMVHDNFIVPKPWTMESVLNARSMAMFSSIEYLQDAPCIDCSYFSTCAEKGITSLMETLNTKKCIVHIDSAVK